MKKSQRKKRILDEVRETMRRRLFHPFTQSDPIVIGLICYVAFHKMKSRSDLANGEGKIESFLTYLAVERNVAPSTQNQAECQ